MRHQFLLMFGIISLFLIGSVFADNNNSDGEPSTSSPSTPSPSTPCPTTAFSSVLVDNCMNLGDTLIEKISENAVFFGKLLKKDKAVKMLTDDTEVMKTLRDNEHFITEFVNDDTVAKMVINKSLEDSGTKKEIITKLLGDIVAKDEFGKEIFKDRNRVIEKVIKDDELMKKLFEKQEIFDIVGKEKMAAVVSEKIGVIVEIGNNEGHVKNFMDDETFRKAAIKSILKDHKSALMEDDSFGEAVKDATNKYLKENSTEAMHLFLYEHDEYVIILKLLILSPMIIAWVASLICIASMCGVCYPFGLSEPSSKNKKSDEKKGKKSSEKKKKGKNDE